jgi:hypothetical protein
MFKNAPAYRLGRLEECFARLEADVRSLQTLHSDVRQLQSASLDQVQSDVQMLKERARPLPSLIVSDFLLVFAEFRRKLFSLLWRGSRDGFHARDFHKRCDGHANTLTMIMDTKGNIFGGFTPVPWDSKGGYRADPSLKSFLFTLKNPESFAPQTCALKADKKHEAIYCNPERGPYFCDIHISENCSASPSNHTSGFGLRYTNHTGREGKTFFAGSEYFQVWEIEFFEIMP